MSDVSQRLYALTLACGALAGAYIIWDGYQVYAASLATHGSEWVRFDDWRVLERGAGVVVLLLTLLFSVLTLRPNVHWAAIPIYLMSYVACFVTAWLSLMIAGKDFGGIGIGAQLLQTGTRYFLPAALLSVMGLLLLSRLQRKTSATGRMGA